MAMLVILAAIALPRFDPVLSKIKLNADARQMAGVLRMARSEAITSGKTSQVIFYVGDSKKPRYCYHNRSSVYPLSPGVKFVGNTRFNTIFNNQPACIFYPSGKAKQGGTITLGAENIKKYVIVYNATGRIRVSDTQPESWDK